MLRKLTREELEEKIRNRKTAEQLDLHGILLEDMDLSGWDLHNINFNKSDIRNVNLDGANMAYIKADNAFSEARPLGVRTFLEQICTLLTCGDAIWPAQISGVRICWHRLWSGQILRI